MRALSFAARGRDAPPSPRGDAPRVQTRGEIKTSRGGLAAARGLTSSPSALLLLLSLLLLLAAPAPARALAPPANAYVLQTVSAHDVVVFSKSYCPRSRGVIKVLLANGARDPFVVDVDRDETHGMHGVVDALSLLYGDKSIPQVFVKGQRIGGNDEFLSANATGELRRQIGRAHV